MLNQTAKEQIEKFCKDEFGLGPHDETTNRIHDIVAEIVGAAVERGAEKVDDDDGIRNEINKKLDNMLDEITDVVTELMTSLES